MPYLCITPPAPASSQDDPPTTASELSTQDHTSPDTVTWMFDELHYRQLINFTTGVTCLYQLMELQVAVDTDSALCLCYYVCTHRAMSPEEWALSREILSRQTDQLLEERFNTKLPFMVTYLTISVVGITGKVPSKMSPHISSELYILIFLMTIN